MVVSLSMVTMFACDGAKADSSKTSSKLEQIKTAGKIVMGTSADYPPYEFRLLGDEDGDIVGIDIDIANEIASELGVKLEVKEVLFSKLFESLEQGKIDMILAGIAPTEQRKKIADFSEIYYQAIQSLLIRVDESEIIEAVEDLRGKKVGVQKDSIQEESSRNQIKGAEFVAKEKITELIDALKSGDVDAIVLEKPVAESYALRNKDLIKIACGTKERMGSAIAVKKGDSDLLLTINNILKKLKDDNKIAEFVWEAKILSNK
jgi:polar amino acid transport system substrate-binding protein